MRRQQPHLSFPKWAACSGSSARSAAAEWTGVRLAAVLERAGVRPGAVEVVLEGADSGVIKKSRNLPAKSTLPAVFPPTKRGSPTSSWLTRRKMPAPAAMEGYAI
ncbi:MAG: molybdopterin-dependent oxidoreductase [Verrucomicrobiota bacterium]|nr:molybdopterin-dependent oxidoreductase [Verrucomicrobiota bacterium]